MDPGSDHILLCRPPGRRQRSGPQRWAVLLTYDPSLSLVLVTVRGSPQEKIGQIYAIASKVFAYHAQPFHARLLPLASKRRLTGRVVNGHRHRMQHCRPARNSRGLSVAFGSGPDKDVNENLLKPSAGNGPSARQNALIVHRSPFNNPVAEPPARNPRSGTRIHTPISATIYGSGSLP